MKWWANLPIQMDGGRDLTGAADGFQHIVEFLGRLMDVAGVAVTPTFTGVGVLAVIVLIRTVLSMSLELEITGRWPWQK